MTAAHYSWPAHTAASTITDHLAAAHNRLLRAAGAIQQFMAAGHRGARTISTDLALRCAISDIRRAQRAHQLAAHNPYYTRRAIHAAAHIATITSEECGIAEEIRAACNDLAAAADAAARLVADDQPIGALGWDLETSIDSALGHLGATVH